MVAFWLFAAKFSEESEESEIPTLSFHEWGFEWRDTGCGDTQTVTTVMNSI